MKVKTVLWSFCRFGVPWLLWALWIEKGLPLVPESPWLPLLSAWAVFPLIWILPTLPVFLMRREGWLVNPKEMLKGPFPVLPGIAGICLAVVILRTVQVLTVGVHTRGLLTGMALSLSLAAGVTEELFFRGFLFNRQALGLGVGPAALINGFLFSLYHFPELLQGAPIALFCSLRGAMLFVFGAAASLAFARYKNLPMLMTVHSVWDAICYALALAS